MGCDASCTALWLLWQLGKSCTPAATAALLLVTMVPLSLPQYLACCCCCLFAVFFIAQVRAARGATSAAAIASNIAAADAAACRCVLLCVIAQVRAARGATSAAAIASNIAAAGYDSDEEVYATAKALQQQAEAEGKGGDSDDDVKVRGMDVNAKEAPVTAMCFACVWRPRRCSNRWRQRAKVATQTMMSR
jgi:hypothetical protein